MPKKSVQLSGIVVAQSAISSIDPDEGILMYRGYDIGDLAERSTYEETALLLLDGDAPSSEALGARCRVGPGAAEGGVRIVLLEPETEGRLSATLARHGEGWVATWVAAPIPPPSAVAQLSGARTGPFGEERLVLGGPVSGPHRLVVEAVPSRA